MQRPATSSKQRLIEILAAGAVLALSAVVYGVLFNRSNVLSHSIGYNLYASERVLEGSIPYRDFHTLYPPGTFYLNAALFKLFGVSLHSALLGVLIFKILTIAAIYSSARQIMPRAWAFATTLLSLLWLRPNGPFKTVPMHYGALFLALAMYLLLKNEKRRKAWLVFLAGVSIGLVALFKHNIGAYALIGSGVLLLFESGDPIESSVTGKTSSGLQPFSRLLGSPKDYRQAIILLAGCATAVVPAAIFMQINGALIPMMHTLLFGPGEFLLSRLVIPLSPVAPLLLIIGLAFYAYAVHKLSAHASIAAFLSLIMMSAIIGFMLRSSQADVNQIIFYLPMFVLASGLIVAAYSRSMKASERRPLLIVFVFSAAALMELFPRFAREQSIAAMPFIMLLLFYLLYLLRPEMKSNFGSAGQYRVALAALPLVFALMEGRLFFNSYFDRAFRFRADTEVSIERGRCAYFPAATASLIDNAVSYIQQRVPSDGNAFAQSDAGTSLLFLAKRRNASNAQFWIGVGVTQEERAATLQRIDNSRTKLIITSDEMLAAEKYEPMRDYIERNFKPTVRFDEVVMLER